MKQVPDDFVQAVGCRKCGLVISIDSVETHREVHRTGSVEREDRQKMTEFMSYTPRVDRYSALTATHFALSDDHTLLVIRHNRHRAGRCDVEGLAHGEHVARIVVQGGHDEAETVLAEYLYAEGIY